MHPSEGFYRRVLNELLDAGKLTFDDSILVLCGGPLDAHVLREMGFRNVTISNLDERYDTALKPFAWSQQDAENIVLADHSFDWALVHAGLHHCASPHKAFVEMCRVARKGALVIEARDSLLMRVAVRLGLTIDYEFDAVVGSYERGGLRNGPIPNYIYRWTEREVKKTVESAFPHQRNDVRFFYGLRLPTERLARRGLLKRAAARLLSIPTVLVQWLVPKQGNQFAFAVIPDGVKPWIDAATMTMRRDYTAGINIGRMHELNRAREIVDPNSR